MANYIVSDTNLTAVADAIRQKGGTSASLEFPDDFVSAIGDIQTGGGSSVTVEALNVTQNGTYTAPTGTAYSPVTVSVSGGGGGAKTGDVRFLDYDGTVVQAYSASEFAELDSLPSNPTHSGLTAQGWNWSLTDAKSYVATHGQLDIGQMYVTDDGKTRIYVSLTDGTLNPTLGLGVNGSVDVDWGDGSEHSTLTGTSLTSARNASHVYAAAGDYVIALTVTGNASVFGSSSITHIFKNSKNNTTNGNYKYLNTIQSVHLGSNISIGKYAFQYCYSLASISLPNTLTSIGTYAFQGCSSLVSISLPNTVTSIGTYAFNSCSSLASISPPNTVTSIGTSAFYYCYSLASISLPNTVTSIGDNAFQNCYSLASISPPNTVTSIGTSAFQNCYGLETLVVPATTATFGANAFKAAQSLEEVTFLGTPTTMPATVFSSCTKLTTINVPWSEGDVANAPWGATNATINYDYTG